MIRIGPGSPIEIDGTTSVITEIFRVKTGAAGKLGRRYLMKTVNRDGKKRTVVLSINPRKYQVQQGRVDHIGQGMADPPEPVTTA